jgi:F-type H+-transporting ATPase subunit epsilon
MHVELVSVEARLWSGEASAVFARTVEGEIGILPRHAPLLAELAPGWLVRIQQDSAPEIKVAVHGGFLSVRPDGVSILAEMAELADDIDLSRAREALRRAEAGNTPEDDAAKVRAQSRLRAAGEQI